MKLLAHDAAHGAARAAAQQAALGAHHARHHHRRRRGDRDGEHRPRRRRRGAAADREPRHQPADGHARRDDRAAACARAGAACRRSPSPTRRRSRRECPAVARRHLLQAARSCRSSTATRTGRPSAQGATPRSTSVRDWPVATGSFFTQRDEDGRQRVAVLGQTVVDQLFGPGEDPVGATIRIKDVPVPRDRRARAQGADDWGQDQDDVVLIPFSHRRAPRARHASSSAPST